MKKAIQEQINRDVEAYLFRYRNRPLWEFHSEPLRHCNARVIFSEDALTGEVVVSLQSYDTIVACIDGNDEYDFLRLVYGYTTTSAQHIAKFFHDYAKFSGVNSCRHTWRPV